MATILATETQYPSWFQPGGVLETYMDTFPDLDNSICPLYMAMTRPDVSPESYYRVGVRGFLKETVSPAMINRIPRAQTYTIMGIGRIAGFAASKSKSPNDLSYADAVEWVQDGVHDGVDVEVELLMDQWDESGFNGASAGYDNCWKAIAEKAKRYFDNGTIQKMPILAGGYLAATTFSAQITRFTAKDSHVRDPLGKRFADPNGTNAPTFVQYYDAANLMQLSLYTILGRHLFMDTNSGTYMPSPGWTDDFYEWLNATMNGFKVFDSFPAELRAVRKNGHFGWDVLGDEPEAFGRFETNSTSPAGRILQTQRRPIQPNIFEFHGFVTGLLKDFGAIWNESGDMFIADPNIIRSHDAGNNLATFYPAGSNNPAGFPYTDSPYQFAHAVGPKGNTDFFMLGYHKGRALRNTFNRSHLKFAAFKVADGAYINPQANGSDVCYAANDRRGFVWELDNGTDCRFVYFNPIGDMTKKSITVKRTSNGQEYSFVVTDGLIGISTLIGAGSGTTPTGANGLSIDSITFNESTAKLFITISGVVGTPLYSVSGGVTNAAQPSGGFTILDSQRGTTVTITVRTATQYVQTSKSIPAIPTQTVVTPGIQGTIDGNGVLYVVNNFTEACQFRIHGAGGWDLTPALDAWQDGTAISGGYSYNFGNIYANGGISPGNNYAVQTRKVSDQNTVIQAVFLFAYNQSSPAINSATTPTTPTGTPTTGTTTAPTRVMVLGNSITQIPAQDGTGWNPPGEGWGMAASTRANDFCSKLEASIRTQYPNITFGRANIADWEAQYASGSYDYNARVGSPTKYYLNNQGADLLIISLTENVNPDTFNATAFKTGLTNIINTAMLGVAVESRHVVLRTCFWGNNQNPANTAIQEYAASNGYAIVDLADIRGNNAYKANLEYPNAVQAVRDHPGDAGHALIASRFWAKVAALYGSSSTNPTTPVASGTSWFANNFGLGPVLFLTNDGSTNGQADRERVLATSRAEGANLTSLAIVGTEMLFMPNWSQIDSKAQYAKDQGYKIRFILHLGPQVRSIGMANPGLMLAIPSSVVRARNWQGNLDEGPQTMTQLSFYDPVAIQWYVDQTEQWINHIKAQPYADAVVAVGACCNYTGEAGYDGYSGDDGHGGSHADLFGYDASSLAAFKVQMQNAFGTIASMNQTCGTSFASFNAITFPVPTHITADKVTDDDMNTAFAGVYGSYFALHRAYGVRRFTQAVYGKMAALAPNWTRILDVGSYRDGQSVRRGTSNPDLITGDYVEMRKANGQPYLDHKRDMAVAGTGGLYTANEADFSATQAIDANYDLVYQSWLSGSRLVTENTYAKSDDFLRQVYRFQAGNGKPFIKAMIQAGPNNPTKAGTQIISFDQWTHIYNNATDASWNAASANGQFVDVQYQSPTLTT